MGKVAELLDNHSLRKTEVRREVLGIFLRAEEQALSSSDIEAMMGEMDRITLYRTLKTFEEKGLIHEAIDGSGTTKYAICKAGCTERHHHDRHSHFHCLHCGLTLCIEHEMDGRYDLPDGYQVENTQVILQGLCADCRNSNMK